MSRKTCVVLRTILVQLMEDFKAGRIATLLDACKAWARQKKQHGMMVPKSMLASPKARAKAVPKSGAKAKAKPKSKSKAAAKSSVNGAPEEDEDDSSSSSDSSGSD